MTKGSRKSSRAANLQRRVRMIANGMRDAGPNTPKFIVNNGKIVKLTRVQYEELVERADSLSYFAGYTILPEQLLR